MLTLNKNSLNDKRWNDIGVRLPEFDIDAIEKATRSSPKWIHIAPSNIYRSMIAPIQQSLIESGYADYGMIAIETHDIEIINDIYQPHDNLCIRVVMFPDGRNDMMVIASI